MSIDLAMDEKHRRRRRRSSANENARLSNHRLSMQYSHMIHVIYASCRHVLGTQTTDLNAATAGTFRSRPKHSIVNRQKLQNKVVQACGGHFKTVEDTFEVELVSEAIVSHKRAGGRHKRAIEVGLFSQTQSRQFTCCIKKGR